MGRKGNAYVNAYAESFIKPSSPRRSLSGNTEPSKIVIKGFSILLRMCTTENSYTPLLAIESLVSLTLCQ